ncbi:aminopeptidase [Uliginosibacterium sp. H1]|uniref:aminopeptidase n=1 Tax=Uliginosibacterium sp. H1 TaxID=3114757 RepID=UPI002E190A04|nr:aminopeptidase [Uliginosibacterium sp. H1]
MLSLTFRRATLIASLALTGCSLGPGYYWQAAHGQMSLLASTRDIGQMRADAPPALLARLDLAGEIRSFASRELGLPDNGSYRRYADLGRPFVVWNVFAAPSLSMHSQEWCLPVAGCVSYLGFFGEADAQARAAELRAQGFDVHVAGIPAYSTLGWFDDPLLSSFINWPEQELARLIFHELAHQVLYVKDDTEFNESFAATVEEAGVRRWLAQPGKEALREQFERSQVARADFSALILKARESLGQLYASDLPAADKQVRKRALFDALRSDYQQLKASRWNGFSGYDRWFAQDLNNATLNSVGLYKALVPDFSALLARQGGDLPAFYAEVERLGKLPEQERRAALARGGEPPATAAAGGPASDQGTSARTRNTVR